jgi:large subunit ribosomal protein L23
MRSVSIWGVEVRSVNTPTDRASAKAPAVPTEMVGQKPSQKRAIVTLVAGEIPLFEN